MLRMEYDEAKTLESYFEKGPGKSAGKRAKSLAKKGVDYWRNNLRK